jgi:two-component system, NtrC family, sensor kinase
VDDAARVAQLEAELRQSRAENAALREEQTATAEVLRVIASSPTDLRRVLQTVVESAARLGEADTITVHQVEGNQLVCV